MCLPSASDASTCGYKGNLTPRNVLTVKAENGTSLYPTPENANANRAAILLVLRPPLPQEKITMRQLRTKEEKNMRSKRHTNITMGILGLMIILTMITLFYLASRADPIEGSGGDPIDGSNVKMFTHHAYVPMHGSGEFHITTAFIRQDQTYLNVSSDAGTFMVYCLEGAFWNAKNTDAGCLGSRGYDHQDYITILPYYTNGYVTSWSIEAGGSIIANIKLDYQTPFYLVSSTSTLE